MHSVARAAEPVESENMLQQAQSNYEKKIKREEDKEMMWRINRITIIAMRKDLALMFGETIVRIERFMLRTTVSWNVQKKTPSWQL